MGYYISMVDSQFSIKAKDKAKALDAIIALTEPELMKKQASGGSFGPKGKTACWYSWVNTEELQNAKTLEEAIEIWGWSPVPNEKTGDIVGIDYDENKIGQESIMFQAIAPYVKEGSYIHISGEGGEQWRWYFDGKGMEEQIPEEIKWK